MGFLPAFYNKFASQQLFLYRVRKISVKSESLLKLKNYTLTVHESFSHIGKAFRKLFLFALLRPPAPRCPRNNDHRTLALLEWGVLCRLLWSPCLPRTPFLVRSHSLSHKTGAKFIAAFTKKFRNLGLCSVSEYLKISETAIEESLYECISGSCVSELL